ncbi:MAG: L-aspartate oxidase [Roseiflexaceae bacterium]|nr:L-aspartate oxidase [Roseiflexaceae bacterium]
MYDYIIIGSGIAGVYTALLAAQHGRVLVLTKAALEESNTRYAQGGIAAAIAPSDSPALHLEDTLAAGAGLCDLAAVKLLTDEAPARIRDLLRYGVPFDRHGGEIALGLEGAHSARRILHAGGDATGRHIEKSLCAALRATDAEVNERAFVTELAVEGNRAVGVWVLNDGAEPRFFGGRNIVLASGGAGQLYTYTTNPAVATGDGMALAYRAGAQLADLEFYQFHPTALHLPGQPTFLISEAVRGEGAYLRNSAGERFMSRYDERGELAARDVVSRAIASEMLRSDQPVCLDLRHLDPVATYAHFPTIAAVCKQSGLDITRDLLPVAPAAHYMMGGVRTSSWGETTLPGLYACGEVACTGVHGANRLASNSLLEGLVFGGRVVQRTLERGAAWPERLALAPDFAPDLELAAGINHEDAKARRPDEVQPPTLANLQELMWQHVGLERSAAGLTSAADTLSCWHDGLAEPHSVAEHELGNLVQLGALVAQAALARRESRGGHFRSDAPTTDSAWRRRIVTQGLRAEG